jgi:RNA polymerase sigma-70 factor (ECF subfamily)
MIKISEQNLWDEVRAGNKEAVEQLFDIYADPMFAYGIKFISDRELVKDCIQNLFLRLMVHYQHLSEVSNVKSYLLISLRHELMRKIKQGHALSFDEDEQLKFHMELATAESMTEDATDDDTIRIKKVLTDELMKLTHRQKEALYLRYVQELPMSEIAVIMDMKNQSVRNLIHRAFQKLREKSDLVKLPQSYIILLLTQLLSE